MKQKIKIICRQQILFLENDNKLSDNSWSFGAEREEKRLPLNANLREYSFKILQRLCPLKEIYQMLQ